MSLPALTLTGSPAPKVRLASNTVGYKHTTRLTHVSK